ncbi:hypothetical protein NXY15_15150 [Bacteroides thetaiotaomicron]|nr:hypothetical protein NXY15_15150 [Bacteroides thetaiotaomicron]
MDDIVAIIVCYFVFGGFGQCAQSLCSAERDETTSAVTAKRL